MSYRRLIIVKFDNNKRHLCFVFHFHSNTGGNLQQENLQLHVSQVIVFQSVQMRSDDLLRSTLCMNREGKQCVPSTATGDRCLDWQRFKTKKRKKKKKNLQKSTSAGSEFPPRPRRPCSSKRRWQPLHLGSSYFLIAFITRLLRSLNWLR